MTTETIETNEVESTEIDVVQTLIALPPKKTVLDVFVNKDNEVGYIVEQVKKYYEGVDKDISTKEKQKVFSAEVKKINTAIARFKEMRLEETRRLQELPKLMIANNNELEKLLTDFRDELRKPLTILEAEEKRIAAEKKAAKEAEKLAKEIELAHREALIEYEERELAIKKAKDEEEKEQKEAAEKLQREAEAKAKADAEYQSQLAIQQAKNAELEAIRAKEQVEREAKEALENAEKEKQAEIARLKKEQEDADKARLAKEEADRKAEEARKANEEHRRTINRAAVVSLEDQGLDYDTAVKILKAIVKGEVAHVTVNY